VIRNWTLCAGQGAASPSPFTDPFGCATDHATDQVQLHLRWRWWSPKWGGHCWGIEIHDSGRVVWFELVAA
jgi:hypothetical protein